MDWLKKLMAGMTTVAALTVGAAGITVMSGCEDDAGDDIEDAVDDAGDNLEEAGENTEDAIKDATN